MKSNILYIQNNDYSQVLHVILDSLIKEKIIIMPSDTIYGFIGLPTMKLTMRKIKSRDSKQFLYLIDDYSMLEKLNVDPNYDKTLVSRYWPGEVTFIFNRLNDSSIGVRMPKMESLKRILNEVNSPLISTSVNKSNNPPINNPIQIIEQFGELVDLIIINNDFYPTKSSTIVDITTKTYKIIRQGSTTIQ